MQINLRQRQFYKESNDFFQNYKCKFSSKDKKAETSKVVTRWKGKELNRIRAREKVEAME